LHACGIRTRPWQEALHSFLLEKNVDSSFMR